MKENDVPKFFEPHRLRGTKFSCQRLPIAKDQPSLSLCCKIDIQAHCDKHSINLSMNSDHMYEGHQEAH